MTRVLRELAAVPFLAVVAICAFAAFFVVLACFAVFAVAGQAMAIARRITGEDRS